jgi:hypothetical protein
MSYRITWPKDLRETAKTNGKSLIAVAYDGQAAHNEFYGPCDDMTAQIIFSIGIKMHTGKTLDEAVAEVKESIARIEANRLAETTKAD